ncbi:PQQ-binding-like beta-propeller repeat protein [Glycomyces sp. NPDC021274]|uniref:outer membrane protein assembly factor BamB family protein n=1 Tax=Glycomyces sp. NPDC021274 TaxID=3155120 RepID=UPI0033E51939
MKRRDADRNAAEKLAAEYLSWPKALRITAASAAGVLVAVPVLLGIADRGLVAVPAGWDGGPLDTLEDLPSYTPVDDLEGGEEPEVEFTAYNGDPAWTYEGRDGDSVLRTDQGFLIYDYGSIRYETAGSVVWEHSWEEEVAGYLLAGDTVLVKTRHPDGWEWPARQTIEAFALEGGEPRWSDTEVSYGEFVGGGVYTSSCDGDADDGGTCVLSARDPATGDVLWSVDDVGASQASAADEETLLVFTAAAGLDDGVQYTARELSTGSVSGIDHLEGDYESDPVLAGGMVYLWLDYDGDPTAGCTAVVRAYPADSGALAWEFDSQMRKNEDLSRCGAQPMTEPAAGRLAVTDGRHPAVIDARTGQIEWTAEVEGQAYGTDANVLAALDWAGDTDNLAGYDLATGEEIWRVTAPVNYYAKTYVSGSTMWIFSEGTAFGGFFDGVYAVNLTDGTLVELPGDYIGGKDNEMQTRVEDGGVHTIHAWPLDLFKSS